jgi:hypothetical protein
LLQPKLISDGVVQLAIPFVMGAFILLCSVWESSRLEKLDKEKKQRTAIIKVSSDEDPEHSPQAVSKKTNSGTAGKLSSRQVTLAPPYDVREGLQRLRLAYSKGTDMAGIVQAELRGVGTLPPLPVANMGKKPAHVRIDRHAMAIMERCRDQKKHVAGFATGDGSCFLIPCP